MLIRTIHLTSQIATVDRYFQIMYNNHAYELYVLSLNVVTLIATVAVNAKLEEGRKYHAGKNLWRILFLFLFVLFIKSCKGFHLYDLFPINT